MYPSIQLSRDTTGEANSECAKQSSIAIASVWTRELIEASQESGSPSASG